MSAAENVTRADEPKVGTLYLVATPIGNLEDITVRALRVLGEVDIIACEDTRQTAKLLHHYSIQKETISYHQHNEMTRAPELVIRMEQGANVALVSDAGTPGISDPGHQLVTLALRHHIQVVPIPGPSALIASLAASGLPTEEFLLWVFCLPEPVHAERPWTDWQTSPGHWSSTRRLTGWRKRSPMRWRASAGGRQSLRVKSQNCTRNFCAET